MFISALLFIKRYFKAALASLVLLSIAATSFYLVPEQSAGTASEVVGQNFEDSRWHMVDKFQGYQTKADPTKIPDGANPNGQNTVINDGDRIGSRGFGYEVVGTVTTTEQAIKSLYTFRKRDGENILIRTRGTFIEMYEEGNSLWESLSSTSTSGQEFGFADYNINTDLRSYVYFGNAVDPFSRWTGAHTLLTSTVSIGATVINVTDSTGFSATGTLRLCGVDHIYTAKTLTTFTTTSTVDCASGRNVMQDIEEFPTNPRGNIYLAENNRIFIAGVTSTPQAIFFSKYGDALTWLTTLVTDTTADAAGVFNLGEGGGAVTGMSRDESSIYFFKKNIVRKATLSDSLYTLGTLKPFDGKSQTTGNTNRKLIFTGGNGTFFVTPDNQIMSLQRVTSIDYPQLIPISYTIQPTADTVDFSAGAGIFWKQSAYFSAKSTSDSTSPDVILIYNSAVSVWESPIIGASASDFAVYDGGSGESLYFGDANTANVYRFTTENISDNDAAFTSNWRSKQFNAKEFGFPQSNMAEMDSVYVEGYISENTDLTISLLLDEDGFTQQFSTTIDGATDTGYIFSSTPYNIFGLHPFGYLHIGSSDAAGKRKFRVYLSKDFRALPFYNAQIEFASESDGQEWEVTAFGFKVRPATQPEKRSLYKAFK